MAEENTNKIRVIVCRPGERAKIVEIEDKLEAMSKLSWQRPGSGVCLRTSSRRSSSVLRR